MWGEKWEKWKWKNGNGSEVKLLETTGVVVVDE